MNKQIDKAIKENNDLITIQQIQADKYRGRSLVIGTAFSGVIEVGMRSHNGEYHWILLTHEEVVGAANSLAAAAGCEGKIFPKQAQAN